MTVQIAWVQLGCNKGRGAFPKIVPMLSNAGILYKSTHPEQSAHRKHHTFDSARQEIEMDYQSYHPPHSKERLTHKAAREATDELATILKVHTSSLLAHTVSVRVNSLIYL